MTANMQSGGKRGVPWRILGWSTVAVLLLLPLVTNAPWTLSDYVFAAVLLGTVGLSFELLARKSENLSHRAGAVLAVIGAFLTVWVNGAAGMIGSEDNVYNLLFLGVPFVALLGSVIAGFRASGMALTTAAAGVGQGVLGAIGLSSDPRGGVLGIAFAGLWLLAAALFHNAARESAGSRQA